MVLSSSSRTCTTRALGRLLPLPCSRQRKAESGRRRSVAICFSPVQPHMYVKYFCCLLRTPAAGQAVAFSGEKCTCHSTGNSIGFRPRCCLQRLDGKKAKGPTTAEFADFMQLLFHKVAMLLQTDAGIHRWTRLTGASPQQAPPMYSLDNDGIHSHPETLTRLGMFDWLTRLPLPAYCPDLHRTVERVHARICGKFQTWLNDQTETVSAAECILQLMGIFYTTQEPSVIESDMSNIRELYQQVVQLRGGRPKKQYR